LAFKESRICDKDAFLYDAENLLHKIERGELVEPLKKSIPMDTLYFYRVDLRWKGV
jgi:hypothetical protein